MIKVSLEASRLLVTNIVGQYCNRSQMLREIKKTGAIINRASLLLALCMMSCNLLHRVPLYNLVLWEEQVFK
jgi:hypothetical protein